MSDQSAEAKATRRRWVTIGEVVGIAALLVSAMSFWDSHRERSDAAVERARAEKHAVVQKSFILTASGLGEILKLKPARESQAIQDQSMTFPTAVRADTVDAAGDAKIESSWIADGVRPLKDDGNEKRVHRVPVAIVTRYVSDGDVQIDRAIYDLAYTLHGRFLRGAEVRLEGLSLLRRGVAEDPRPALDAIWARRAPAKAKT